MKLPPAGLYAVPGTLRKVTALVSVATIEMSTRNQPTLRSPTKYAFKSFCLREKATPNRVIAST